MEGYWIVIYLVVTFLMAADCPRDHYGRFTVRKAIKRTFVAQFFLVVLFLIYWLALR